MSRTPWVTPLLLLAGWGTAYGQEADTLRTAIREVVRVTAPVVALTHVQIIDGTGAEPIEVLVCVAVAVLEVVRLDPDREVGEAVTPHGLVIGFGERTCDVASRIEQFIVESGNSVFVPGDPSARGVKRVWTRSHCVPSRPRVNSASTST